MTSYDMDPPAKFSFDARVRPESDSDVSVKATKDGAFISEGVDAAYYKPIDSYEGLHRWDPKFVWEPAEETRVVRKVCPKPVMVYTCTDPCAQRSTTEYAAGSA